jgi:hypothetical protein
LLDPRRWSAIPLFSGRRTWVSVPETMWRLFIAIEEPSIDRFIILIITPLIHTFGLPSEVRDAIFNLIRALRADSANVESHLANGNLS